jgi:GNAT superfamily N-acetyltransferase
LKIRDATPADLVRIVELLQQLSLSSEVRERDPRDRAYAQALADITAVPHNRVLVAEVDGDIVGTAELFVRPNLSHGGRPVAEIESVVVDERCRGRGIGEALVRFCIDAARTAGCFRVQLTSNATRKDAHRFYERLGFNPSHTGFKLKL